MNNIVKNSIKTYEIVEQIIDIIENFDQIEEQITADLNLNGINTEIKQQVIQELADKITSMDTNIIIMVHE